MASLIASSAASSSRKSFRIGPSWTQKQLAPLAVTNFLPDDLVAFAPVFEATFLGLDFFGAGFLATAFLAVFLADVLVVGLVTFLTDFLAVFLALVPCLVVIELIGTGLELVRTAGSSGEPVLE